MSLAPAYCRVCKQQNISTWSVAKDYEYFSVDEEFTYYGCADCGTIFIHPIPVDQLKKIYPSNYYSFANKSKNIVVRLKEWLDKRFFKRILKQLPDQEISVLDIGGGTGWMPDVLKKTDSRINFTQIVDIDEKAKSIAEENSHAYFEGTIENFETDKKFHLILMLNLIEHVADPLTVLQKAQSLLAPGGIIVIKTPNTDSWDARLYKKSYWGGLHCPRHWVIFSEKSFRQLLQSTSLKIKKLTYTQGAPFWAFSIIAALHRQKIVRISAQKPIIFHWLFAPISAVFAVFDFIRRPFAKTSQLFIILTKDV
ncbi:MAG: class I SAM-dependent methyltransferase [Bacteroidota bacterium]|nr:class I SAM-dependent methyltransferase [Chitinophagaceae bacterium]MDZ4808807.1 class I SAM-dependent methyltransferase [Bacteroidota bacterium]